MNILCIVVKVSLEVHEVTLKKKRRSVALVENSRRNVAESANSDHEYGF